MKDRSKREAFLVSDQESSLGDKEGNQGLDENLAGSSSEGEEGSGEGGKGAFARLVSVEKEVPALL